MDTISFPEDSKCRNLAFLKKCGYIEAQACEKQAFSVLSQSVWMKFFDIRGLEKSTDPHFSIFPFSNYPFFIVHMVSIVQSVRTPGCGPGGRGFKSHWTPEEAGPAPLRSSGVLNSAAAHRKSFAGRIGRGRGFKSHWTPEGELESWKM